MNIEVSNEMIENIARDLIKERVKQFFNTETNKNFIRKTVNSEVQRIVAAELRDRHIDIKKIAGEYTTRDLFNRVAEQISEDIAEAYAYKYGD